MTSGQQSRRTQQRQGHWSRQSGMLQGHQLWAVTWRPHMQLEHTGAQTNLTKVLWRVQKDTGLADWSCTLYRRQPVEFWLVRCVQAKSDDCQLVCCHFRIWQPNKRLQSCSSTLVMFLPCSICGTESAGSPGLRAVHCKCCLWTIGAQGAGKFPDVRCIRVPSVSQFKQYALGCRCAGHTTHSGGHSAYRCRLCYSGVFWQPHQRDLHITAAAGLLPCVRPSPAFRESMSSKLSHINLA